MTVLDVAMAVTFVLLGAAGLFTFLRLAMGPSLPDRVLALDMVGTLSVAFAAAFATVADESSFVDVAVAFALIAFLSTVALARYAERRAVHLRQGHLTEPRDRAASDLAAEQGPHPDHAAPDAET